MSGNIKIKKCINQSDGEMNSNMKMQHKINKKKGLLKINDVVNGK